MDRSQFEKIIEKAHRFDLRVYWEDTDAGGRVYYANYLKFAERARTESLRELGFGQQELLEKYGVMFVVYRCSITYHGSAILDDRLSVYSHFYDIGISRIRGTQLVVRQDGTILTHVDITLACLDQHQNPERMPDDMRQILQNHTKTIE